MADNNLITYSNQFLKTYSKPYFVGVKGVAVSSMAQIYADNGYSVSGCDTEEVFVTDAVLTQKGVGLHAGFNPENLPQDCSLVVYTGAHQGKQNPVVQEALARDIPIMTIAEAISRLFYEKDQLCVCGVGGKSTVSAMVSWILTKSNQNPSYSVGVGKIHGLEKTGSYEPHSRFAVIEADEYAIDPTENHNPRLSLLKPFHIICTNAEHDHPDIYPTENDSFDMYATFIEKIPKRGGLTIMAKSFESLSSRLKNPDSIMVLETPENTLSSNVSILSTQKAVLSKTRYVSGTILADLQLHDRTVVIEISIPGEHNMVNAALAFLACSALGISDAEILDAIKLFQGTQRRLDDHGVIGNSRWFDDYGHHPIEVLSVIDSLRKWLPDQTIGVVFESHTFSRTKQFFSDFVEALATADEVYFLDIFPSAREPFDPTISSDQLVEELTKRGVKSANLKTIDQAASHFASSTDHPTVMLTLGAGNVYQIIDNLKHLVQ